MVCMLIRTTNHHMPRWGIPIHWHLYIVVLQLRLTGSKAALRQGKQGEMIQRPIHNTLAHIGIGNMRKRTEAWLRRESVSRLWSTRRKETSATELLYIDHSSSQLRSCAKTWFSPIEIEFRAVLLASMVESMNYLLNHSFNLSWPCL